MDLQVRRLSPDASAARTAWQGYVDRVPAATFYHTLSWMDTVADTFAHRPHYLMAWRGDRVAGVFPLFEVRSFLAGTLLVSVPYGVYGGAVADDQGAADALLAEARRLARQRRVQYIDIRSQQACWPTLPTVHRYVTFCKKLPADPGEVLGTFPRKARAEVRRARDKFGLAVRFDDDQLKVVWRLYCQSMRRLGSPNMPYRFFAAAVRHTPEAHLVSVVYHGRQPLAGLLSFIHGDTVLPYFSGCAAGPATQMSANNFLYATLMEAAVARGLRRFDFGRTRVDNRGAYAFKKNQGFEPQPLSYQFDVPAGAALPNLTPSNPRFHLAQRIWKRLPLMLTRPLGSWLSGAIPG